MHIKQYLYEKNRTLRWFAKQLDVTEPYLSMVKNKRLLPGKKLAMSIEKMTKGAVTVEELRHKPLGLQEKVKARTKSLFV